MRVVFASQNYFDVLGVHPEMGRGLNSKTRLRCRGRDHRAQRLDAGVRADPSVIGRSIRVADQFVEVVGVAPPSSSVSIGTGLELPGP